MFFKQFSPLVEHLSCLQLFCYCKNIDNKGTWQNTFCSCLISLGYILKELLHLRGMYRSMGLIIWYWILNLCSNKPNKMENVKLGKYLQDIHSIKAWSLEPPCQSSASLPASSVSCGKLLTSVCADFLICKDEIIIVPNIKGNCEE